jgi:hypothetical protein
MSADGLGQPDESEGPLETHQQRRSSKLSERTKRFDSLMAKLDLPTEKELWLRLQMYNVVQNRRAAAEALAADLSPRFRSTAARLTDEEIFLLDLSDRNSVRDVMNRKNELSPRQWVSSTRAAEILGKATNTLAKWRSVGRGPRGWKQTTATTVMYPLESVLEYLDALRVTEVDHE